MQLREDITREWLAGFRDYQDYREQITQVSQAGIGAGLRVLTEDEFDRIRYGIEGDMEHTELDQKITRVDAELDAYKAESSHQISTLLESTRWIREMLTHISDVNDRLVGRFAEMDRKLDQYNNVRERVDQIDAIIKRLSVDYVPRPEFNGALNSLRSQIKLMQWIFGIGATLIVGLLSGLLIFLLGGA